MPCSSTAQSKIIFERSNLSWTDLKQVFNLDQVRKRFHNNEIVYSHFSNKRGGWNKRREGAKDAKSIDVVVVILQLESSHFVFKLLRYWVKHVAFTAKL